MSEFKEFETVQEEIPTIVVDVRATAHHSGKTTIIRALWKALADLGLDPKAEMFTIDSTDEDVTPEQILSEEIDEYISRGIDRIKERGIKIHFVDTNKRPLASQLHASNTQYQCRYRVQGQPWSDWSLCSEETYRTYVETPNQGNTEFETRAAYVVNGGVNVEVAERALIAIHRNILALNEWSERMSYDVSLIGEPAGLLKGKIRELAFVMNNLINRTYITDTELNRALEMAKPHQREWHNEWRKDDSQVEGETK